MSYSDFIMQSGSLYSCHDMVMFEVKNYMKYKTISDLFEKIKNFDWYDGRKFNLEYLHLPKPLIDIIYTFIDFDDACLENKKIFTLDDLITINNQVLGTFELFRDVPFLFGYFSASDVYIVPNKNMKNVFKVGIQHRHLKNLKQNQSKWHLLKQEEKFQYVTQCIRKEDVLIGKFLKKCWAHTKFGLGQEKEYNLIGAHYHVLQFQTLDDGTPCKLSLEDVERAIFQITCRKNKRPSSSRSSCCIVS